MAKSRSVPTALLEDPLYYTQSSDTQIILLDLILKADDEGRGLAEIGFLSRTFNKEAATITKAMETLCHCGLLQVYQVEHSYYQLTRWEEWETLSKPAPSRFPSPPVHSSPNSPGVPRGSQGFPGDFGKTFSEEEEEGEEEQKRTEEEAEDPNPKIVPLHGGDDMVMQKLAEILKLVPSEPLLRVVQEYQHSGLSLTGEADAAREWLDSPQNKHRTRVSIKFFRNWLERSRDERRRREQQTQKATGTEGQIAARSSPAKLPDLTGLETKYRNEMNARKGT